MPRFRIVSPFGEEVVVSEDPKSALEVLREKGLPFPYYVLIVGGRPAPLDAVLEGDEEGVLIEVTSRG